MSASPLTALPIAPPTQASSTPPPSSHNQHGPSFTSHLQNAQHQQQAASDQSASQNGDAQQNDSNSQTTNTQASAGTSSDTAKPGTDTTLPASSNDTSDDSGIDIGLPGVGTLASAVLSLIDHATSGDTHGDASASTNGATAKATTPATKQPATAATPIAPLAPIVPVPLPVAATAATTTTNANGNANNAVGGVSSNGTAGNGLAGAMTGLQKDSLSGPDFSASGANGGDANAAATAQASTDATAATQGANDVTQALAGSMVAATHTFAAAASAITDNTSQSTAGLTALGNLTATAPVVPTGTNASGAHNLGVNAQVGSSGFAKELGQQITWLSGQDIKQAQIRLNPQDLGPLDVKVSVEHGRVDVSFMTQHPAATAAVQQGLSQLNQMLSGQGLSLGHATVGQHAQQQFGASQQQQASYQGSDGAEETAESPVAAITQAAVGLVDAFA
ncbi:flagellar hook-length control protein FliK [Dyella sp. 2HG41-7]|uniref:flagellar hook-length control protein FliK n=1 Tax=Dyella sp. 2HG41-7 TaxID=2883239 RepID=UPI001F4879F9|nr:flagellar hook-length control protein FliK [Dyella sp. 2HG41-7]